MRQLIYWQYYRPPSQCNYHAPELRLESLPRTIILTFGCFSHGFFRVCLHANESLSGYKFSCLNSVPNYPCTYYIPILTICYERCHGNLIGSHPSLKFASEKCSCST